MKLNWIPHNGGECPVAPDSWVLYKIRLIMELDPLDSDYRPQADRVEFLTWGHSGSPGDIMAYIVVKNGESSNDGPSSNDSCPHEESPLVWPSITDDLEGMVCCTLSLPELCDVVLQRIEQSNGLDFVEDSVKLKLIKELLK